jgi:MFS family permease
MAGPAIIDTAAGEDPSVHPPVPLRAWVGLGVLLVLYLFSFLDKQMFALLANPMGEALHLTDVQLSLLQGVGFSLLYSFGVLGSGWLVDRYSRPLILFVGVVFWSLAGAASGLATSFSTMLLARAGVGLGEAVLPTAANSLVASLFPRHRMSLAVGIYYMGANLGGVVALIFGGAAIGALIRHGGINLPLLGQLAPWQAAFLITGLPGVVAAFLVLAIRAPARPAGASAQQQKADALECARYIGSHKALVFYQGATTAILTLSAYALIYWGPAFVGRVYHWSPTKTGFILAAGVAMGGVGNVSLGALSDWVRKRGHNDATYIVFFWALLIGMPTVAVTFLSRTPLVFIIGYPLTYLFAASFGPLFSTIQLATPARFHGRLFGLQTFAGGIVGLGVGPVVVALITEHVFHDKSRVGDSVALSIVICSVLACILLFMGRKSLREAVAEQDVAERA